MWHSPSLGVLAGVSVLWHSPSLGVLAGVSVLWQPKPGCSCWCQCVVTAQAWVFLLVSVCCDTAQALVFLLVSVCCDTTQALLFLLVSACCVTQPKPCCSCWCQCVVLCAPITSCWHCHYWRIRVPCQDYSEQSSWHGKLHHWNPCSCECSCGKWLHMLPSHPTLFQSGFMATAEKVVALMVSRHKQKLWL